MHHEEVFPIDLIIYVKLSYKEGVGVIFFQFGPHIKSMLLSHFLLQELAVTPAKPVYGDLA